MKNIEINISNKIATLKEKFVGVCGNSDYVVMFNFDDEWESHATKTARFKHGGQYTDVVFTGNECPMPIILDTASVEIGVYAGNLHTTTSACVLMKTCILSGSGVPADPTPDVYNQIIEKIDAGMLKGDKGDKGDPGSDAEVTAANIQAALGYTSADKVVVDQLAQEIAELKGGGTEQTTNVVAGAGYVKYDTGAISNDSGGWNTGYVETAGFEKAEYYGRMNSSGAVLAFYDVNKLYLQNGSVAGSPDGIKWVSGSVSIPADAAYTIVSSYGTGHGSNNGGAGYLRLFSEVGSGGIAGLEADIADLTGKVNPIKGKRFAVLGDSISSLSYTLPVWWQLIAEKYGCSFENYSVSASRIAVSDSETPSFIERYAAMDDTVDGVVVVGGTNDAWYTPIGTFDSTDNTTLNGALNELLPALLNKYPGKPVLFFAPIQREDYTEGDYPVTIADLKTLNVTTAIGRDRVNLAIMVKCRQYGVPCVDLYTACGINGNDANSVYFRTDDNLHPSELGMQRIAGVVAAELVRHFNFVD